MCNKHALLNLVIVFAVILGCLAYPIYAPTPTQAAPLAADWTGWFHNLTLAVRNNATTGLPVAYTVQLTIDTASLISQGQMQSDCDDLRLSYLNAGNDVELDRLVEGCNTTATTITFRTQAPIAIAGADTNYRLHYGQPAAGNAPSNLKNIYAAYDDFQDGDAAGWIAAKGNWSVVNDGGNFIYRYAGGGANWALAYLPMTDLANLDYGVKIRATNSPFTNWIGAAFRIQDQNNFLTFYQSRDSNQFKYARIANDNHSILQQPAYTMTGGIWYRLRLQAIGNQMRARIWPDGSAEPSTWTINQADVTYQTASNIGATLYNHVTNADWDDFQVRKLVDVEPTVNVYLEVAPWWNAAWGYRARATVTNSSVTESLRVHYSVHATVDTAALIATSRLLNTCDDLRVVSFDGLSNTELDRAVENCGTDHTEVWFALPRAVNPGGQDNGFYLYYGNSSAGTPPANAANVFLFYEDWEQGAVHWTNAGGLDPANTGTLGASLISNLEAVSPSHSQQFPQKRSGGDAFSGYIPINPNTSYAIGAWAKSATSAYVPVGVDPYDAAYVRGAENWLWTNEWTVGPQWTYRSARFTTGSNWAYIKIKSEWWMEGPGTEPVYLDNLVLRYAIASEPVIALGDEETTLPVPTITNIHDTGPIELGGPIGVTADVISTEGTITAVTLRITSPETADVPMSRTTGDTFSGAFTPQQGGVYTHRIFAQSSLNRSKLSAAQTFTVTDTQPPQLSLISVIDPIQVKNTQTLIVAATDNGRVERVTLSTGAAAYVMSQQGNQFQHAWPITQVGTLNYTVIATDTVGNHASLTGSFNSLAREVDVCTWKDCKPAAASWSNDDSNSNCRAELEAAGFRGTFYVNGSAPQQWYTDYSAAGHEIGAHTVGHPCNGACCGGTCTPETIWQCPFTETDVTSYRSTQFDPNVAAIETATNRPVLSGAWPCGCTDAGRMTAAMSYFLGVRGYNDCGCNWVQDNNAATPIMFMNLNGLHAYDQTFIDRAMTDGKWTIVTSHGSCEGISYMGSQQSVLWLPTVGEGLKYIKVRDAAQFSHYSRAGRTITFDAVHNLTPFVRQQVSGASLLPIAFDNAVTLKAHILETDNVLSVEINGVSTSYTVRTLDGARYVVFDTPLNSARHVVITLSKPAPTIDQVSDNGPIELGNLAHVTAHVMTAEGPVQNVMLHVVSPQAADYAMTLVNGFTDVYEASFTSAQLAAYTYRISASNDEGATSQSTPRALTVRDTTAPQWRAQAQTRDALQVGEINTLSAEGLDRGGLQWAILATNEAGTWHEYDWPASDWWNHQWPQRRAITIRETVGLARMNETIDVLVSSAQFTGLTNCAADLRVADANRVEVPRQVYDEQNDGGTLTCHLLFQATIGANTDRVYYLYYGNPNATAPAYTTDLASSAAGNLLTIRNTFLNLDLDTNGGVISRVQLPAGSNTNLPLSTPANVYWGWHQVCSSLHGNITGRNQLCVGGSAPATGLALTTSIDGPIVKVYELTSVKDTATYRMTYRFFANTPYYQYDLARTGTSASVMNNFWYVNGYFSRLGFGTGGTPSTVFNAYDSGADQIRAASFAVVDTASIDGSDNDGTQLGATDYQHPTATGLALYVTTGATQQATQDSLARIAAPLTFNLGVVENAPPGQYGSPLELNNPIGWTPTSFTWQNAAVANGTTVQWHIKYCDLSGNCGTTGDMSFRVGPIINPPPLPSHFYGEINISNPAPNLGDAIQVTVPDVAAPFNTTIQSSGTTLTYAIDVPGDVSGTPEKEGGTEREVITFTIGGRVVATGIWHSGTNTRLDFHSTSISLQPGWNLVSFNLIPVSSAITDVLSSLAGHFDLVYAWNGASQQWLKYDDVAMSQDTLLSLNERAGFWIHFTGTQAQTLTVYGQLPATPSIPLSGAGSGWNLVGYPSAVTRALPDALSDHGVGTNFSLVYAYHASESDQWKLFDRNGPPFVNDLPALTPGWGYWIKCSANMIWTFTYSGP